MESPRQIPRRFAHLPVRHLFGVRFPVATSIPTRLRGLACLEREIAGPGLLIPRCRSVHTFWMRFPIDVLFLDREGRCISVHQSVGAGRLVSDSRATSVLESIPGLIEVEVGEGNHSGGRERAGRD